MDSLKDKSEYIDAVFTSPPYYGQPEPYNNDPRDLCNMSIDDFDKRIDVMFGNLKRLIKTSDHKNKKFYPMIFVVGTFRRGQEGIYDMDRSFQNIAKSHGLTLWDKQFLETNNPHLVCSLQRNYELKMVHKNVETSLVFVKFWGNFLNILEKNLWIIYGLSIAQGHRDWYRLGKLKNIVIG